MSKSLPAIAGLGAAACVVLSLMMKNLVEVQSPRAMTQLQRQLEAKFAAQLVGHLAVKEETVHGRSRLVASACVMAGLAKERLAESVGSAVWRNVVSAGLPTTEVQVVVTDERGGPPASFVIPRPPGLR